ncbi:C69 family dipeptidase [Brachybacterium sp. p3-SID957]|uniref:C69 family dipeptidase n=1 Tax=Brachybacterium sp. p3-SID957 TaxID=2916049 RepID=UPI00223B2BD4|nr:C69 family dipeptidase [Brachybacterium sp. p3-SID957]MCT1776732.1 C69 family dipeptidase [Brachybacterium sp. p3-SID957]
MTGCEIEELRFTAESVRETRERLPRFSNWPVVYLIEDGHDIYVGETGSADRRMAQHLKSTQKQQSPPYTSLPFTTLIPMLTNVEEVPAYLTTTEASVSTDSFYWTSRMIAALADAHFAEVIPAIERCQQRTLALGHAAVHAATAACEGADEDAVPSLLVEANTAVAEWIRTTSNHMTNRFSRLDG